MGNVECTIRVCLQPEVDHAKFHNVVVDFVSHGVEDFVGSVVRQAILPLLAAVNVHQALERACRRNEAKGAPRRVVVKLDCDAHNVHQANVDVGIPNPLRRTVLWNTAALLVLVQQVFCSRFHKLGVRQHEEGCASIVQEDEIGAVSCMCVRAASLVLHLNRLYFFHGVAVQTVEDVSNHRRCHIGKIVRVCNVIQENPVANHDVFEAIVVQILHQERRLVQSKELVAQRADQCDSVHVSCGELVKVQLEDQALVVKVPGHRAEVVRMSIVLQIGCGPDLAGVGVVFVPIIELIHKLFLVVDVSCGIPVW